MRKDSKSCILVDNLDQINEIDSNQREDAQNLNNHPSVNYISINDILSYKKKKMEKQIYVMDKNMNELKGMNGCKEKEDLIYVKIKRANYRKNGKI